MLKWNMLITKKIMNKSLEKITEEIIKKLPSMNFKLVSKKGETLNLVTKKWMVEEFVELAFIAGARAHRNATRIRGGQTSTAVVIQDKSRLFFKKLKQDD